MTCYRQWKVPLKVWKALCPDVGVWGYVSWSSTRQPTTLSPPPPISHVLVLARDHTCVQFCKSGKTPKPSSSSNLGELNLWDFSGILLPQERLKATYSTTTKLLHQPSKEQRCQSLVERSVPGQLHGTTSPRTPGLRHQGLRFRFRV